MAQKATQPIIVIDDEQSSLKRFTQLFVDDYPCYTATTGEEGLRLYQTLHTSHPFVICDINLPDISGFEVCQRIKTDNPAIYVIFLSAHNDLQTRLAGCHSLANMHIDKNRSDEEIKLIVHNNYYTVNFHEQDNPNEETTSEHNDLAKQVKAFILSHYEKPKTPLRKRLSSGELAEQFCYSHRDFQRKIKESTNESFKAFYLLVRLEKSQELLSRGFPMDEVAYQLDFSSHSHFARAFRTLFDMTPSQYRNQAIPSRKAFK